MKTLTLSHSDQDRLVRLSRNLFKFLGFILVMAVLVTVTTTKLTTLRSTGEELRQGFTSVADRTKQLDCLAKNIYWEAASEPFEGKVAVAQVTMNRLESGRFAKDVCGVVYQKNVVYDRVICQFSWFCENNHKVRPVHPALFKESEEVAKKVLLENFRLPSMKDALYYHADYVSPGWKKPKIGKIGAHIFYKD
jgi:spore germination cell wall hydrolase CwlJ-like protein